MEPTALMGASSTAVAVDGGDGNVIVPVTIDENYNIMASAAMASLTDGSGGAAAMAVIVIDCAVVVDAAATILLSLLTAVAKTPLLSLPSTVAAVDDSSNGGR